MASVNKSIQLKNYKKLGKLSKLLEMSSKNRTSVKKAKRNVNKSEKKHRCQQKIRKSMNKKIKTTFNTKQVLK